MISSTQGTFCPINYGFEWTADGWYTFPYDQAHLLARDARDAAVAELKAAGRKVKKFSSKNQLVSKGGIGSGRPHIEELVTVYGYNVVG